MKPGECINVFDCLIASQLMSSTDYPKQDGWWKTALWKMNVKIFKWNYDFCKCNQEISSNEAKHI